MEDYKVMIKDTIKTVFRIVTPWKKQRYNNYNVQTYEDGWNDCLKDMKKRQKQLLKRLEGK